MIPLQTLTSKINLPAFPPVPTPMSPPRYPICPPNCPSSPMMPAILPQPILIRDKTIHANKGVLDSITQESVDKWNTSYVHPNSGVTAGTYKSVTVNAQGHVTNGTDPTTLAGYGITDAAAKSHTHNYAGSDTPGGAAASAAKLSR